MTSKVLHILSFRKNNVKTFLFFLMFTSFLWLFIQFSKNYTQEVEFTVTYKNIPESKVFNESSDQKLKLTLNGNGFRMINYTWSSPKLVFNFEDAIPLSNSKYYFLTKENRNYFKEKLDFKGNIISIHKDTLMVLVDINKRRKVPIRLVGSLKYAVGYGSGNGLQTETDSVMISGPKQVVDTLNHIYTKEFNIHDLKKDYKTKLVLNTTGLPKTLIIQPESINATIKVSKFTEGKQKIPVLLKNVPKDKEINIFPKEVMVIYSVGLDQFNSVKKSDFEVFADFDKIQKKSSFLVLELVKSSPVVYNVRLQDKQVQYVIINQK